MYKVAMSDSSEFAPLLISLPYSLRTTPRSWLCSGEYFGIDVGFEVRTRLILAPSMVWHTTVYSSDSWVARKKERGRCGVFDQGVKELSHD